MGLTPLAQPVLAPAAGAPKLPRQPRTCSPSRESPAQGLLVPGIALPVEVKIAAQAHEWEEAFRLVAHAYRSQGYVSPESGELRFTPHHALPGTVVFVAESRKQIIATCSLIPDNRLLGLPIETVFGPEIAPLRQSGVSLAEVGSLASVQLRSAVFLPIFATMLRLLAQYAVAQGTSVIVISVNPQHGPFYRKMLGFAPLGPVRSYAAVQGHPAEAYRLDIELLRTQAPAMHQRLFGQPVPARLLKARGIPPALVRSLAVRSGPGTLEAEGVGRICNPSYF